MLTHLTLHYCLKNNYIYWAKLLEYNKNIKKEIKFKVKIVELFLDSINNWQIFLVISKYDKLYARVIDTF